MIIKRNIRDKFKDDDEFMKYVNKMKTEIANSFVIVHKDKFPKKTNENDSNEEPATEK